MLVKRGSERTIAYAVGVRRLRGKQWRAGALHLVATIKAAAAASEAASSAFSLRTCLRMPCLPASPLGLPAATHAS